MKSADTRRQRSELSGPAESPPSPGRGSAPRRPCAARPPPPWLVAACLTSRRQPGCSAPSARRHRWRRCWGQRCPPAWTPSRAAALPARQAAGRDSPKPSHELIGLLSSTACTRRERQGGGAHLQLGGVEVVGQGLHQGVGRLDQPLDHLCVLRGRRVLQRRLPELHAKTGKARRQGERAGAGRRPEAASRSAQQQPSRARRGGARCTWR